MTHEKIQKLKQLDISKVEYYLISKSFLANDKNDKIDFGYRNCISIYCEKTNPRHLSFRKDDAVAYIILV